MLSRDISTTFFYEDLFDKDVLYNLEMIRMLAERLDHDFFDEYLYGHDIIKSKEYAKEIIKEFIASFFNNKYNLLYNDFVNIASKTEVSLDETADGYVMGLLYLRRVNGVYVPNIVTFTNATAHPHEFSHYLNIKCAPKMNNNILLIEVPSVFIQHMFLDYCIKNNFFRECGNLKYIYHYDMAERFLVNVSNSYTNFKKYPHEVLANAEDGEEFISDTQYYYAYIYANMMYNYYLEDEKKFKKRFVNLYQGGKLEELLRYYNIDLKDEKTVDTTYNLVKKLIK